MSNTPDPNVALTLLDMGNPDAMEQLRPGDPLLDRVVALLERVRELEDEINDLLFNGGR